MKKAIISSILVSLFASMSFASTGLQCTSEHYRVTFLDEGRTAVLEQATTFREPISEGKLTRPAPRMVGLNCQPTKRPPGTTSITVECEESNLQYGSFKVELVGGDNVPNTSPTVRLSKMSDDQGHLYPYPIDFLRCVPIR